MKTITEISFSWPEERRLAALKAGIVALNAYCDAEIDAEEVSNGLDTLEMLESLVAAVPPSSERMDIVVLLRETKALYQRKQRR